MLNWKMKKLNICQTQQGIKFLIDEHDFFFVIRKFQINSSSIERGTTSFQISNNQSIKETIKFNKKKIYINLNLKKKECNEMKC